MIVADTNLIVYALVPGPHSIAALRVLAADGDWWAPPVWRSEMMNALSTGVRVGGLDLRMAQAAASAAEELMAGRSRDVDSAAVLAEAADAGHPSYDCEFVVLARTLGVPVVTADAKLLRRFPGLAVSFEDFVSAS